MARLSAGQPAGCVAEEILAVGLIDQARMWLEMQADAGEISSVEADVAIDALSGLFDLFEDDDVLRLFDMHEPSDAAVDRHAPITVQLGVADQRMDAWFAPFGWVAPTGHLHDAPSS
jgi:hypothetical protein